MKQLTIHDVERMVREDESRILEVKQTENGGYYAKQINNLNKGTARFSVGNLEVTPGLTWSYPGLTWS